MHSARYNIKCNFTKFLIGRDGKVIKRLEPEITHEMMEADILVTLGKRYFNLLIAGFAGLLHAEIRIASGRPLELGDTKQTCRRPRLPMVSTKVKNRSS